MSKVDWDLIYEAEPVQEHVSAEKDDKKAVAQADDKKQKAELVEEPGSTKNKIKKFSKFGFLYSKKGYTVEQELKSVNADCVYEIMNCPIPGGNGSQTLGHEYDVCYLSNCQTGAQKTDEPTVKRSQTKAKISSDYGVAVL